MLSDSVRPKLRLDARFLPLTNGVLFRSRGKVFTLKGSNIYEAVCQLAPYLSGQFTVSDLCNRLAPQKRAVILDLLNTLAERQVLIGKVDEAITLPPAVEAAFRPQIGFIEHFADRPLYRFSRLRSANVFVSGSGAALAMMCVSLVRNGFRTIILDRDATNYEQQEPLTREVQRLQAEGVEVDVAERSFAQLNSGRHPTAICCASDEPNFAKLLHFNEYAIKNDVLFLPGYVLGGKAVVGPCVRRQPVCLVCALIRRTKSLPVGLAIALWQGVTLSTVWQHDVQPASYPALRILGNLVAFELFKAILGHLPQDTDRGIASVDLETLETRSSQLIAEPQCPHCSPLVSRDPLQMLNEQFDDIAPGPAQKEQSSKFEIALDPEFGLFHGFDDDDLPQTPLFRSSLSMPSEKEHTIQEVPGYSISSNAAARTAAFLEAAKKISFERRYPKNLFALHDPESLKLTKIEGHQLSHSIAGVRSNDPLDWMFARSVITNQSYVVPYNAVFTVNTPGLFEHLSAGTAAAFSTFEAKREAVSSLIACELLKRASRNEMMLATIDFSQLVESNSDVGYLLSILHHLQVSPSVRGSAVPDFGAVVLASNNVDARPEDTVVGSGLTIEIAAARALMHLLAGLSGGRCLHLLEAILPSTLGYDSGLITRQTASTSLDSVVIPRWFDDILICDATPPDLVQCEVTVYKALMTV